MNEMVERIALAIYSNSDFSGGPGLVTLKDLGDCPIQRECYRQARAAIAAMADPTERMLEAAAESDAGQILYSDVMAAEADFGGNTDGLRPPYDTYRLLLLAMIEAALKDTE